MREGAADERYQLAPSALGRRLSAALSAETRNTCGRAHHKCKHRSGAKELTPRKGSAGGVHLWQQTDIAFLSVGGVRECLTMSALPSRGAHQFNKKRIVALGT